MEALRTQVKNHLLKKRESASYQKDSFWPTEAEANQFDIYQNFKGTPQTNVMTVETQFGLGMRKKLEEAVIEIFNEMKILVKPKPYVDRKGVYLENPDQHRVDMMRMGVKVSGYMDGIVVETEMVGDKMVIELVPVEIKTSYGLYQQKELILGRPKLSYLKQLAVYVDYIQEYAKEYIPILKEMFPDVKCELKTSSKGYLFQTHFERDLIIDDIYQFVLVRDGNTYRCGEFEFDLYNDVYKRFKRIWDDYIVPDIEPPSEYVYKYPVETVDWKKLPSGKIANARNNKAVVGDWQVIYSGYKDLIIERQGTTPGYTEEELEYIKEQTKGYTTWNKK